jgi:4-amino-4-deoxy-L-arabinose transferase-like glycosyltransferase
MVFFALTLLRYPAPWYDEPLYISMAWSNLHPGQPTDLWAAGAFDRFEGYWTILSWQVNAFVMAGLAIAGSPSLAAARMVSLFWGFWLLVACYWIGKRFGGYPLAIWGVVLVALTRAFLVSSHMARPDIMGAAYGYLAIALYLNHRGRSWISASAGLLAVLAFEIHGNGAFFTPVILGLFLIDHGRQLLRQCTFWAFILGCLAGGGIYLATHVLLYPETYRAVMVSVYAEAYRPPILTLNPAELWVVWLITGSSSSRGMSS